MRARRPIRQCRSRATCVAVLAGTKIAGRNQAYEPALKRYTFDANNREKLVTPGAWFGESTGAGPRISTEGCSQVRWGYLSCSLPTHSGKPALVYVLR